ncbi:pyridoxal-phosphate dependent enzyme [Alcaligenaceae bacterium]|nr:pyridoxal-phosphate dependent enzyme [Alcaligenaceae bacterium]
MDTIYVPIGCGSGICSVITARDALGLATKIVGVVSSEAPAAKLSFEAGCLIQTESAYTFADGLAVRMPVAQAFELYAQGADRIVSVTDTEVAQAIRIYYQDTHNLVEGAGAAALAALLQDQSNMQGKQVGVILSGANIDMSVYAGILSGDGTSRL